VCGQVQVQVQQRVLCDRTRVGNFSKRCHKLEFHSRRRGHRSIQKANDKWLETNAGKWIDSWGTPGRTFDSLAPSRNDDQWDAHL
jgi:hypothetical protein